MRMNFKSIDLLQYSFAAINMLLLICCYSFGALLRFDVRL
jgi:hypothetical protein